MPAFGERWISRCGSFGQPSLWCASRPHIDFVETCLIPKRTGGRNPRSSCGVRFQNADEAFPDRNAAPHRAKKLDGIYRWIPGMRILQRSAVEVPDSENEIVRAVTARNRRPCNSRLAGPGTRTDCRRRIQFPAPSKIAPKGKAF